MTATALLADLSAVGIRVEASGDRLHWKGSPRALTDPLRQRLAEQKADLLRLLQPEAIRAHLLALAAPEGLPAELVDALPDADVAACGGLPDDTLRAYLRMLDRSAAMDTGTVPEGYTQAVMCGGCGPVWLWPGTPAHVIACPWCYRRKARRAFPQPEGNGHG